MEIKIDLAGTILRITGPDEDMFLSPGVLAPFVTDRDCVDREVYCAIAEQLPSPPDTCIYHDLTRWEYRVGDTVEIYMGSVGKSPDCAYIWAERSQNRTEIRVLRSALIDRIPAKTILYALEAEHLIAQNGGFLLHCSYIAYRGEAILFTAPSGIGKSTQAELWRKYRGACIINGDRAAVRLTDTGVEAWGIPFSGSSGISHRSCLPVRAIVCLSQTPSTTIHPLTGVRAFRLLWEGCSLHTWNRDDVTACTDAVLATIARVPVFHLACTPDESAVLALEEALLHIQR